MKEGDKIMDFSETYQRYFKDILPLYIDDIASNDTNELVEEHIKYFKECRKELENLSNKDYFKEMGNENMEEIKTFKKIKSTIKKKK